MSSSLVRLPESAVELTLTIPGAATKAAYEKSLASVAKNISIPGFRKGAKIPSQVIENAFNKQGGKRALRTQAINELVGELMGPALKDEHGLEPIGQPTLVTSAEELAEGSLFVPGEALEVKVKCDVWPEIRWKSSGEDEETKPYMGLKGSYKRKPFNQERFDTAIRDLIERFVSLEPIDDGDHALTTGDAAVVNMEGFMATADGEKGEKLPEGVASGDNVEVVLGQGLYMEGLVEGIEGGKIGETKTVKVTFPQALRNKDLAGKDAIFDVTILSASRRILPELTDEFADKVRTGLTVETLKDELRTAVDSQDAQEYAGARNEALGVALAQVMDVDVPDTLVTNQAREKYAVMMTDMRNSGMDDEDIKKLISPENFLKYKDISKEGIVRDFKVSMAVDEIARLESIEVPAYQVEEQLQSLKDQATKDGQNPEDIGDEDQVRKKVESTLERRAVYDFLAEGADLEVEFVEEGGFDEGLMEKLAQESQERDEAAAAAAAAKAAESEEEEVQGKEDEAVEVEVEVKAVVEEVAAPVVEVVEAVEAVVEEVAAPAAEVVEEVAAPVVEEVVEEEEAAPVDLNEGATLEDKAFNILTGLGMVDINPDPDSPDFDASKY